MRDKGVQTKENDFPVLWVLDQWTMMKLLIANQDETPYNVDGGINILVIQENMSTKVGTIFLFFFPFAQGGCSRLTNPRESHMGTHTRMP